MTKLEAQGLAIVITNAENFASESLKDVKAIGKAIEDDLSKCYKTKQRARLQAKMDEIVLACKQSTKVVEEMQEIVKAKRAWLIESEGEDIFKGIAVTAPKTTGIPLG